MKADLKARWVEALRSGKYEQGQYHLRRSDNTFCCLGVLCDVIDPSGWGKHGEHTLGPSGDTISGPAANRIGLCLDDRNRLMDMNDDEDKSFSEIADEIERLVPVEG